MELDLTGIQIAFPSKESTPKPWMMRWQEALRLAYLQDPARRQARARGA